jgi:hypothetical protein
VCLVTHSFIPCVFIETFLLPSTILGIEDSAMNNQLPLTQFQEIEMKKKYRYIMYYQM